MPRHVWPYPDKPVRFRASTVTIAWSTDHAAPVDREIDGRHSRLSWQLVEIPRYMLRAHRHGAALIHSLERNCYDCLDSPDRASRASAARSVSSFG